MASSDLWMEILAIFSDIWFAIALSLYFTNIFTPKIMSAFLHPACLGVIIWKRLHNNPPNTWLHFIALISLVDIWNGDFFAYLTILASIVFYAVSDAQMLA